MTTATASVRTLTASQYEALPVGLDAGRIANGSGMVIPPQLGDFTVLDAVLADAVGDTPALDVFDALLEAADSALRRGDPFAGLDPHKAKASDVATRARQVALLAVLDASDGHQSRDRALNRVTEWLRPAVQEAFVERADQAITRLRPNFEADIELVTQAHRAGVTSSMTHADIAATASPDQVEKWRKLQHAVAELDRIAALRARVHHLLDWEHESRVPQQRDDSRVMACFLAPDADEDQRVAALALYCGQTETVLVQPANPSLGPTVKHVVRPRTGGAWLTLVAAGHRLTLQVPSDVIAGLGR